jgi:hypothetical protein
MKPDLTRWNRAGLSRLAYVDGDAAVWLEEIRLALFGLYSRGQPVEQRLPDLWRDHFMQPKADWLLPDEQAALAKASPWPKLVPVRPPEPESRGRRSKRLLAQYEAAPDGDQAWEVARAFARAAHVVLGHLDAHAGEGYLRTATQWDNLRRLAAMVNYQPGPPASAATLVALTLKPEAGMVAVPKGLAARHTPPGGGLPLVFETLAPLLAHPDLNAARPLGWDRHPGRLLTVGNPVGDWLAGPKVEIPAGALALIDDCGARQVVTVASSERLGTVLRVTPAGGAGLGFDLADVRLWAVPEDVRAGLPRPVASGGGTGAGMAILQPATPLQVVAGDIVELLPEAGNVEARAVVLGQSGKRLRLAIDPAALGAGVQLRPMLRLGFSPANTGSWVSTPTSTGEVWFVDGSTATSVAWNTAGRTQIHDLEGGAERRLFSPAFATDRGYVSDPAGARISARVETPRLPVSGLAAGSAALQLVSFAGKPPKRLSPGSRFVARGMTANIPVPLEVLELSVGADDYTILFDAIPPEAPDLTEFHGPMTEALRALGHDRNPTVLGAPRVALAGLSPEADALLKPGRRLIVSRLPHAALQPDGTETVTPGMDTDAVIAAVDRTDPALLAVVLTPSESINAWPIGYTLLRLNAVTMGHGESKGALLLGSGDAERVEQSFRVDVEAISHIASTTSTSGEVPDVDVAVDGLVWPWRDFRDLSADGAQAWSSTLTEDGRLVVHFRRRLPTGTNNVSLLRHRVGTGARGTGVPAGSLKEPAKKDLHVAAIVQPFPTGGGADRESVASLRVNAPAHLAANGRAVSARDFERLATAQAMIWRARAEEVPDGGALRRLKLVVVPSNGSALTPDQIATLRPILLAHALPGVRLDIEPFRPLHLTLAADVRADLLSHDAGDVKAACEAALQAAFGLEARDFAQAAYAAEVMAVLETVPAVETAVITGFGFSSGTPAQAVQVDAATAAFFPHPDQVLFLPDNPVLQVNVRGLS